MKTKLILTLSVLFLTSLSGTQELKAQDRYYVVYGSLGHKNEFTKNFVSKVIKVDCDTDWRSDDVKNQLARWYKTKYGKTADSEIIIRSTYEYKGNSYNDAVEYRDKKINRYRGIIELPDKEFSYLCPED